MQAYPSKLRWWTTSASGAPTLRDGVAADRRISIEDGEMRHGRKSRSLFVDGYKRHIVRDLDSGLIPVVGVTAANAPEQPSPRASRRIWRRKHCAWSNGTSTART